MSRLDRVLAAGVRQRQLQEVRTGTVQPDWFKFFGGNQPSVRALDPDELAAYKAMANRVNDVLSWYEQRSSDHYAEELEFLERALRFDVQPMRRYDDATSAAVATAVPAAISFLQKTTGARRAPFYHMHRGVPQFHDGSTGEAYFLALSRLKLYFEKVVREQGAAQLFGSR